MALCISPLLLLPAELRLQIYTQVFAGSSFYIGRDGTRISPQRVIRHEGCETRYQIVLACHFVYREARPVWYSSTVWTFADPHMLRSSMIVNEALRHSIRHLHIIDLDESTPTAWLASVPSLKTLTINVPRMYVYCAGNPSSEALYSDARALIVQDGDDEHNTSIHKVFRRERTFELSVLFRTSSHWKGEWTWHISHMNLDLHSLTSYEYNVEIDQDSTSTLLSVTKRLLTDYAEQKGTSLQQMGDS